MTKGIITALALTGAMAFAAQAIAVEDKPKDKKQTTPAEATTVKSSKSNGSEKVGNTGGPNKPGDPAETKNLNSSRSNKQ